MKKYFAWTDLSASLVAVAVFSVVLQPLSPASGAPAANNTTNTTKPQAGTASTNTEPEIPLSVFAIPAEPKEGRDPFFPNSLRPYAKKPTQPSKATPVEVALTLTGITPTAANGKFAMVNGRTFTEGEEGDIRTASGLRRLRCIKIKEDSVIVELLPEGERKELRMRVGVL